MPTSDKEIDNVPDNNSYIAPVDSYGFNKLTVTELRKEISERVKAIDEVTLAKKTYNEAANDTIKANKQRMAKALEFLKLAEVTETDVVHENNVTDFLARKNAKA
jgi:hypothetical protein